MVKGLVSVVIPTYNRGHLAVNAAKSVLAQTYPSVEVLIVDDGSKDDTRAQVERAFSAEKRVRYIPKANGGVSSARNLGFREARGEFVALLDSDDIWLPNKVALQLGCLEKFPEAGMVWSDMDAVSEEGALLHARFLRTMYSAYDYFPTPRDLFRKGLKEASVDGVQVYSGDILSPMILGSLVHTSTVLLRKERQDRVGFFDEGKRVGEDYPFHLRTSAEGPVAFVDAVTIKYTIGAEDALSSNAPVKMANIAQAFLDTYLESLKKYRDRIDLPEKMLNDRLAQTHAWLGDELLRCGRNREARKHHLIALRTNPRLITRVGRRLAEGVLSPTFRAKLRSWLGKAAE